MILRFCADPEYQTLVPTKNNGYKKAAKRYTLCRFISEKN